MKKVILQKRIQESGEREKLTIEPSDKIAKTENDETTKNDMKTNADESDGRPLIIDETRNNDFKEEFPMDLSAEGEKMQGDRGQKTMFTELPDRFVVKEVRQVVPCKGNIRKRLCASKEGFTRVQFCEKRSKVCGKEYEQYTQAVKEMDRDFFEEEREFDYINKISYHPIILLVLD